MLNILDRTTGFVRKQLADTDVLGDFILAARHSSSLNRFDLHKEAYYGRMKQLIFSLPYWNYTPQGETFWSDYLSKYDF